MENRTVDPGRFRHVVGHLTSGVCVVTTRVGSRLHGMTASSVTSLSVDPPMMVACINNSVPTAPAIESARGYVVNVLGEDQVALAKQFATPSDDKFRGVGVTSGVLGLPLLEGALATLECAVTESVVGGTHSVFLGQVVAASATAGEPLAYFRGGFGRLQFQRNDEALATIRDLVLRRVLSPGSTADVQHLATLAGVDKTAAFYALTRLSGEGLIRRDPVEGYVVAPLDAETACDVFDARLAIEVGALSGTGVPMPDQLQQLELAFTDMSRHLVGKRFVDFEAYVDANCRFHQAIVALSGSATLMSLFDRLTLQSIMIRGFGGSPETSEQFLHLQREILDGLMAGSVDDALTAASRYCEAAKARVRDVIVSSGGHL